MGQKRPTIGLVIVSVLMPDAGACHIPWRLSRRRGVKSARPRGGGEDNSTTAVTKEAARSGRGASCGGWQAELVLAVSSVTAASVSIHAGAYIFVQHSTLTF